MLTFFEKYTFILIIIFACFLENNFLLLATSSQGNINQHNRTNSFTKVLIIGAGPAGIAAASRLAAKGITDFLILEAEDRIGGRVYTTTFEGSTIEIGGQYVHGELGNVVFELANPLGLLEDSNMENNDTGRVSDGSGEMIDDNVTSQYLGILDSIEKECIDAIRIFKGSILDFYKQEYKRRLKEAGIDFDSSPLADPFLQLFRMGEETADGSDYWAEQSAPGRADYWKCKGNNLVIWKRGGYHTLLDILTRRYPDPNQELPVRSKVLLNKEVVSIQWEGADKVVTTCVDGSVYLSNHVLVTVSLGVLKNRSHSLFQPALPTFKLTAIQGLGIGTVDKIFLLFPHQWWSDEDKFFTILWTSEAVQRFNVGEEGGSRRWLRDMFVFHPVPNVPNVLLSWLVGPSARQMEALPLSAVMEGCMELLQHFFGRQYNIPPPLRVERSAWGTNQHFRGSYSFRSVASVATGATPALLAHPLVNSQGKQVVMFAGEATNEHHFSTVHGAVETGFREAERLAPLLRVQE